MMRNARKSTIAIAIMCLFALMFALAGCANGQNSSSPGSASSSGSSGSSASADSSSSPSSSSSSSSSDSSGSSNSADSAAPSIGQAKFVIIHTNDTHGYDEAADGVIGMAAVAQLKKDYIAQGYDVLLLDAGDSIEGNLLADDSQGEVVPEFMNVCGYDAAALGNHDFDYGADVLQTRMKAANFPFLCANITVDATGELFAQPNTVLTLSDGTKVGVFGIDTPETMTKSAPKNTAGLSIAEGDDLYACAQKQVDELKGEGCNIIVCLGHLGEDDVSAPNRASDLVANTEGIDLLIDGHDHQVENTTVKDKAGKDVPIFETGCYLANIGVVTYENGAFTETLVAAGSYAGSDTSLADKINAVSARIDESMGKKVGTTPFVLNGEKSPGVRDQETNLGDFIVDAYRWEAKQALGTMPDAAIINGGSIRTSIPAGDITLRDIHNATPFINYVTTVEVTGAQLLEAIESACQGSPEPMGAFPQVSGITYTLDVSVPYEKGEQYPFSTYYAPAKPGARVTISDVNGKGFDLDAKYKLATIDFVASGGDTYCVFTGLTQSMQTTGYLSFQAIQYYLEDECGGVVPDEYAKPQGRVTVKGQ